jgi:hypothetical protein
MATTWASTRPIRDRVERNNELNCRISQIPVAPAETFVSEHAVQQELMGSGQRRVEAATKIATRPPPDPDMAVDLLSRSDRQRTNFLCEIQRVTAIR